MATLVFTALGTALGGPIGALGSLIGNRIDRAVIGGPKRRAAAAPGSCSTEYG